MEFVSIINITPDSFSDGGENNDLLKLEEKIQRHQECGISIFDFGAESTAPFNDPISEEEELERYQALFFPLLEKNVFNEKTVFSIDTYKAKVFKSVYLQIRESYPESTIWWNDVSGIVEEEDWQTLAELDQNTAYIFAHTFVPTKSETSQHMNYLKEDMNAVELGKEMAEKFVTFQFNWNFKGIKSQLILDPCFGFSKNAEQNYGLISQLGKVFKNVAIDVPVMLGLSRKSFLRKIIQESSEKVGAAQKFDHSENKSDLNQATEVLHWQVLRKLSYDLKNRKKFIRAHDPLYFLATERLWDRVNII